MKILYVDLEYDYGMKHRGPNVIGQGFKKSFVDLGHEVDTFYYDHLLEASSHNKLQSSILEKVESISPDLIYFILFKNQFDVETIKNLSSKAITVNWFGDDQWRFNDFTSLYAPAFTWSITTDPFALSRYHELGVKNVFLSQWAALDMPQEELSYADYEYDVSFVGASNSVRRWFVKELKKRGVLVNVFGYGWPSGPVSLERMFQIFRRTKINLNLGNSVVYDFRYLKDSFKNPIIALKEKKNVSQMKARNFEIPYYGGFQLTDFVPKLDLYFNIGKEVACYSNIDEAALQIKYYLESDEERESIRKAGIKRAQSEHNYFHRHKKFFEHIQC